MSFGEGKTKSRVFFILQYKRDIETREYSVFAATNLVGTYLYPESTVHRIAYTLRARL